MQPIIYDSDDDENNFEAFFDEEGDDIMAEIILRMYEMETGYERCYWLQTKENTGPSGAVATVRRVQKTGGREISSSGGSQGPESQRRAALLGAARSGWWEVAAGGRGGLLSPVGPPATTERTAEKAPEATATVYNKNDGRGVVER